MLSVEESEDKQLRIFVYRHHQRRSGLCHANVGGVRKKVLVVEDKNLLSYYIMS